MQLNARETALRLSALIKLVWRVPWVLKYVLYTISRPLVAFVYGCVFVCMGVVFVSVLVY